MEINSGILWPLAFSLLLIPVALVSCFVFAIISSYIGNYVARHFLRNTKLNLHLVISKVYFCTIISQCASLIVCLLTLIPLSSVVVIGSEFLIVGADAAINIVVGLFVILLSVAFVFIGSYRFIFNNILHNKNIRVLYCVYIAIINGGAHFFWPYYWRWLFN